MTGKLEQKKFFLIIPLYLVHISCSYNALGIGQQGKIIYTQLIKG